jgi:F420H(2)-dependent quinone reductase
VTRVRGDHGELGRARGQRGYNTKIIKEFRAIGAESGIERSTPLAFTPSQAAGSRRRPPTGSPSRLGLYYNLKANPEITVELSTQALTVLAQELYDTARAGLWPSLVAKLPDLGRTQAK